MKKIKHLEKGRLIQRQMDEQKRVLGQRKKDSSSCDILLSSVNRRRTGRERGGNTSNWALNRKETKKRIRDQIKGGTLENRTPKLEPRGKKSRIGGELISLRASSNLCTPRKTHAFSKQSEGRWKIGRERHHSGAYPARGLRDEPGASERTLRKDTKKKKEEAPVHKKGEINFP